MRPFGTVHRLALACILVLGLSAGLGSGARADIQPRGAIPPSVTPDTADGVIQAIGVAGSKLGADANQLTFLPTGAAGPVSLTVDRPADKQALDLGARPGDRIWLTVDDPINPRQVIQITRIARPVPPLQRTIALVGAFAAIAALAALATSGKPWRFAVGDDNRLSNSQSQLMLWFGVVAVVYGGALFLRAWFLGWDFIGGISMTTNVLAMTGLSGLSFGAAKMVAVQKGPTVPAPTDTPAEPVRPKFTDLFLNDYGDADLGDFQMILISLAAALIFACASWQFLALLDIVQTTTLPDIDTALLGSFGVGQGAYLIKKAALPAGVG